MGEGCTALQASPACRREEARPEATCDDAVATPAVVSPVPAEEPSPLAGLPAPRLPPQMAYSSGPCAQQARGPPGLW